VFSELGTLALEEAKKRGASYADIRIGEISDEVLTIKNGAPKKLDSCKQRVLELES